MLLSRHASSSPQKGVVLLLFGQHIGLWPGSVPKILARTPEPVYNESRRLMRQLWSGSPKSTQHPISEPDRRPNQRLASKSQSIPTITHGILEPHLVRSTVYFSGVSFGSGTKALAIGFRPGHAVVLSSKWRETAKAVLLIFRVIVNAEP